MILDLLCQNLSWLVFPFISKVSSVAKWIIRVKVYISSYGSIVILELSIYFYRIFLRLVIEGCHFRLGCSSCGSSIDRGVDVEVGASTFLRLIHDLVRLD